jgi:hypothetical protein
MKRLTHIWIFLKFAQEFFENSEIFFKKCQENFEVRLGNSWRTEILHEHALLDKALKNILRFGFF